MSRGPVGRPAGADGHGGPGGTEAHTGLGARARAVRTDARHRHDGTRPEPEPTALRRDGGWPR
ncbi:hypothetical protein AQJ66_04900 [Streptomyces bungoensis]|uniref:Uncharacterized protein n=1 Tax=Streptomyces bungoensis TaxID=285568 RepID=A0A101TC31_9ACTN|nr:hypothetical protein AQJ66_04900 [Streptomyces bungoensis]